MNRIGMINVALETFGALLSLVFFLCVFLARPKREALEKAYLRMLACNVALLLCDACAWLCKGYANRGSFWAVRVSNFAVYVLSYVMLVLFTQYLVCFLEKRRVCVNNALVRAMRVLLLVAVALTVLSQYNGMYYTFSAENVYQRGPWFWLSQAFGLVGLVLQAGLLLRYHGSMQRHERWLFAIYMLLPAVALGLQMLFYGLAVLHLATTLCLMCIYFTQQAALAQELAHKERELEKGRTTLLLSQIQPHFLYNVLGIIQDLCHDKAPQAEQAAEAFAVFLNGNLDALQAQRPVAFSQELRHVQSYLALEALRFGSRLHVSYRIEAEHFFLPALTVQPLVENAVRHGAMAAGGGSVEIASYESAGAYHVAVLDSGMSFSPGTGEGVGLQSVRARLRSMCGGTLEIRATQQGTLAEITIAKEGEP